MSFDLFILFKNTDKTHQQRWVSNLDAHGIECKFPNNYNISEETNIETNIQCRLHPPLVKKITEFSKYTLDFSISPADKDFLNSIITNSIDKELIEKLNFANNEIQLSSSSGRDDNAFIIQCFMAASLADASNGVLFDPQQYGASHGSEAYETAKKLCFPSLDDDEDHSIKINYNPKPQSLGSKISNKIEDIKCLFNGHELLSPYFEDLSQGLNIKYPYLSEVRAIRSQAFVGRKLKNIKKISTNGAYSFREYLILKMLNIDYNLEKLLLEVSQKCLERSFNNEPTIWIQIRLACAKTVPDAKIPHKETLLNTANDFSKIIKSTKLNLNTHTLSKYLTATISALLADNPNLALNLLDNIKNHDEFKRHIQLFSALANEMLNGNKGNISQSIEKQFFNIFNYHLLSSSAAFQTSDSVEYECSYLFSGIGNYLFTWLYLLVFKNKKKSTWSELRLIMMGNKKVNYNSLK